LFLIGYFFVSYSRNLFDIPFNIAFPFFLAGFIWAYPWLFPLKLYLFPERREFSIKKGIFGVVGRKGSLDEIEKLRIIPDIQGWAVRKPHGLGCRTNWRLFFRFKDGTQRMVFSWQEKSFCFEVTQELSNRFNLPIEVCKPSQGPTRDYDVQFNFQLFIHDLFPEYKKLEWGFGETYHEDELSYMKLEELSGQTETSKYMLVTSHFGYDKFGVLYRSSKSSHQIFNVRGLYAWRDDDWVLIKGRDPMFKYSQDPDSLKKREEYLEESKKCSGENFEGDIKFLVGIALLYFVIVKMLLGR
jgi:hypothetical protein